MMLRADKVTPAGQWSGAPADTVVLDFDERYRRRFVMTGVGGLEFLLDLAEAAMLRGGDGLNSMMDALSRWWRRQSRWRRSGPLTRWR